MLNEVLLIGSESFPVPLVLTHADLVDRPKHRHLVLVHLPNVVVDNREDHESIWVLFKQWLR